MRVGEAPTVIVAALLVAFTLGGCMTAIHPGAPSDNAPATVDDLAAAIAADARRSDTAADAVTREKLSAEAMRNSNACLARAPTAAACLYYHAVALGLEARAHPVRAGESLKSMLEFLTTAEAADRAYDHAGPARVRALVLLKAPGWPLGPGDADAGLVAARRAAEIEPDYPANALALADALTKSGDAGAARSAYNHARQLAAASPASADRDDWLHQADRGIDATR